MTVLSTTSSQRFHGSGSTGPFTFSFRFLDNADIQVYLIEEPDEGNLLEGRTLLTETDDYTLTGAGAYSGGSVTLTAALEAGTDLLIARLTRPLQELDIRNQGNNFYPELHEEAFDALTFMAQDVQRVLSERDSVAVAAALAGVVATDTAAAAASATEASGYADDAAASAIAADASADEAATQEGLALLSAQAASGSAAAALASEEKAEKWAEEAEDTEVETGKYSAKHWAAKAEAVVTAGVDEDPTAFSVPVRTSTGALRAADAVGDDEVVTKGQFNDLNAFVGALAVTNNSGGQTIPSSTSGYTAVIFNLEDYDTSGFHSDSVEPARMTVPAGISHVRLMTQVFFSENATGYRLLRIVKNNLSDVARATGIPIAGVGSFNAFQCATPWLEVAEGDFFEVHVMQNSGGNLLVMNGAGASFFAIEGRAA